MIADSKPILIIGGGIAGMTAAVEAAEVGCPVILVEREPTLGGRVIRSYRYFPKMCPPTCGFEINLRRIRQNPLITVHTLANVEELTGSAGAFAARIAVRPRYVTGDTSIDRAMVERLSSERPDDLNMGLTRSKALYMPHPVAYPALHALDREALSEADAALLAEACPPGAIDLEMQTTQLEVEVGAVIVATGWRPYDAGQLDTLGFGRYPNVITNLMMERYASPEGPTGGAIVRPSDGRQAQNVAFVQCAGSRDDNHLPYCSAVCCMASMKQARYVRDKNEGSRATIFYIDIRAVGRLESFYTQLLADENVDFIKGKVAEISEEPGSQDLTLKVADTVAGTSLSPTFDLVVLATGIVPNTADAPLPIELGYDDYGFLDGETGVDGVFAVGCAVNPCDVSRSTKGATAAVLKAIQCLRGGD